MFIQLIDFHNGCNFSSIFTFDYIFDAMDKTKEIIVCLVTNKIEHTFSHLLFSHISVTFCVTRFVFRVNKRYGDQTNTATDRMNRTCYAMNQIQNLFILMCLIQQHIADKSDLLMWKNLAPTSIQRQRKKKSLIKAVDDPTLTKKTGNVKVTTINDCHSEFSPIFFKMVSFFLYS